MASILKMFKNRANFGGFGICWWLYIRQNSIVVVSDGNPKELRGKKISKECRNVCTAGYSALTMASAIPNSWYLNHCVRPLTSRQVWSVWPVDDSRSNGVWLLRIYSRGYCRFDFALPWVAHCKGSDLPCHEDARVALWRHPCEEELRPLACGHVGEWAPLERALQPQISAQITVPPLTSCLQPHGRSHVRPPISSSSGFLTPRTVWDHTCLSFLAAKLMIEKYIPNKTTDKSYSRIGWGSYGFIHFQNSDPSYISFYLLTLFLHVLLFSDSLPLG